ncbi:MAG: mycothiol transferase [Propionibacteriaceae bacterium]
MGRTTGGRKARPAETKEILARYLSAAARRAQLGARGPLDAEGHVLWWPPERNPATLGLVLVHLQHDLTRHAGHADIISELIDGAARLHAGKTNLPDRDLSFARDEDGFLV